MQAETTPNKPKQRTLQEVFNVVLDAGLYWDWDRRLSLD